MAQEAGHPPDANDALAHAAPLEADVGCEVAIIGGGVTGGLLADMLAATGVSVAVFDRRRFGAGSTAASTALLVYELDTSLLELSRMHGRDGAERVYLASLGAQRGLQRVIRSLPDDCGFTTRKSLYLASNQRDADKFEAECAARRAIGIAVDLLAQREIEQLFPFSAPAALLSHDGAQCDPLRLTRALLRRAASRGALLFPETRVTRIDHQQQPRIALHTDTGHRIRAQSAIIATGYESHDPNGLCPRRIGKINSTYAVCSRPIPDDRHWHERWLLWESAHPYVYLRTTSDGRAIIGGEDVPFKDEAARDALLPKQTARLEQRFRTMFPTIDFHPEFRWTGTFGETEDGLPCIGGLPETPQCLYALGYGGNGITFGMLAAEILRDTVLGARHEVADLFTFDRAGLAATSAQH